MVHTLHDGNYPTNDTADRPSSVRRLLSKVAMAIPAVALFAVMLVTSAEPASAHETSVTATYSNATVNAAHSQVTVCHVGPGSAEVLVGTADGLIGYGGTSNTCRTFTPPSPILSYILCDNGGCVGTDA